MLRSLVFWTFVALGRGLARPLDLWIYQVVGAQSGRAWQLFSHLGDEFAYGTAALTAIYLARRSSRDGRLYLLLLIGQHLLASGGKWIFHTFRPEAPHMIGGYAFPSGHTLTAVCVYGFLATLNRGWIRRLLWCLPLLVAAARVALGVHWLSDVVGAWLLGWLWLDSLGRIRRPQAEP